MDPLTLLLAGTTYAASLVAKKAADDLAKDFWTYVKASLSKALGREPAPGDVTREALQKVAAEPVVQERLRALVGQAAVLRRAQLVEPALRGARILWIDDRPEGNVWEYDCLTALGTLVKTVETTRSAVACLEREPYDLVISDAEREGRPAKGIEDLPSLQVRDRPTPVILYVTDLKPGVPPGAFGITARPDELLHLCMDALERSRL
jgi:hypothetical protein